MGVSSIADTLDYVKDEELKEISREVCEAIDGVVYKNLNPEIITINENGLVYPTGIVGLAKVIVMCGGKSFEVEVEIKE